MTDTDNEAQTYDPSEVDGHMFGVSEANATSDIYGPNSPAGKLYQKLTGHQIPPETDGDYANLVEIFDALQAAGPDLTPQNMARGTHALPVLGAPSFSYGAWSWNLGPDRQRRGRRAQLADRRPVRLVERHRHLTGQRQAGQLSWRRTMATAGASASGRRPCRAVFTSS